MNKLAYFTLCIIGLTALFSSCSDDEKAVQAAATLQAVKATSHSLEFTITPQHAEQCAWMCYKKGESAPTADEILKSGIPVDIAKTTSQRAIALEPETRYIVLAAAVRKGIQVISEPLEMKTEEYYAQQVPVVQLKVLDEALYLEEKSSNQGNYVVRLGSAELANNKMPVNIGDIAIQLDLYNAKDEDPTNATLPSGEYTMAKKLYDSYTWNAAQTIVWNRISNDDSGLMYSQMHEGSIQVQRKGDTYTIDIDVVLEDGEPFRGHFKGDIIFERFVPKKPGANFESFTENLQITWKEGQARYIGSWFYPHADNLFIEFFDGTFNEQNNSFEDGYFLYLTTYMHKLLDYNIPNPKLEEGTYQVFNSIGQNLMQIPLTINKGALMEIMGQYYPQGSYVMKVDSQRGKQYINFITEGSMEVKQNGDMYDIVFHFTLDNGLTLDCTYNGVMNVVNKNNNDQPEAHMPPKPETSLKQDVTLAFDPNMTEVDALFLGNYLYPNLNSWNIYFLQGKADMIQTEFFTDPKDGMNLPEGVYTISREFKAMNAFPGFSPFKEEGKVYTWYGDMRTTDAEGFTEIMAPIAEGTMTVSKTAKGYKFVFDFIDDGGHKIQGEWEGKVNIKNNFNK